MLQGFEWFSAGGGVHWRAMTKRLESLAEMGVTSLWAPPCCKGLSIDTQGYDLYDLFDIGEFPYLKGPEVRTRWGTKEEFQELVRRGKEVGIDVYIDAVMNHKAGADITEHFLAKEVSDENRNLEISQPDGPGLPSLDEKELSWNFSHFTGVDWDESRKKNVIFKIEGKKWSELVDDERGSFDYLMFADVDHSNIEVRNEYFTWGNWILKETNASGFRLDAIKHIDEKFIYDFVNHVRRNSDTPVFFVGEFWKDSLTALTGYLDRFKGTDFSIFDTPLHFNFQTAANQGSSYDLSRIMEGSLVSLRPEASVTFVDNHDSQIGNSLESWVHSWFKPISYAIILLRNEGLPCVFLGDLDGILAGGTTHDGKIEKMAQLADFIRIRKLYSYGETRDYFDYPSTVGWVRAGDRSHPDGCAIVVCNGTQVGTKSMEISPHHAGEIWTDVLGWSKGEIKIAENGLTEFRCPAGSVSVWVRKDAPGRDQFKN